MPPELQLAFALFFLFWLLNHSLILAGFKEKLFGVLPDKVKYALECPLCASFWMLLPISYLQNNPLHYQLSIPAIVMFLELIRAKLV
jgi:hypothetical protein